MICIEYGVKLPEVTAGDGASNTVMFNEVRVGVNSQDRRGVWAMGFAGSSLTCGNALGENTSSNLPTEPSNAPNTPNAGADRFQGCATFRSSGADDLNEQGVDCQTQGTQIYSFIWADQVPGDTLSQVAQARSRHPGGVNTCFTDGSVRFVRDDINPKIWRAMLTRNGSEKDKKSGEELEIKPYSYDF
jgi:prepilin-type processing-associated H-X9-DG protein